MAGAIVKFQKQFIEGAKIAIADGFLKFEDEAPRVPAIEELMKDVGTIEKSAEKAKRMAVSMPAREFAHRENDHAPKRMAEQPSGSSSMGGLGRKILTVLAQFPDGMDVKRLAILAGSTVNGHFNSSVSSLRTSGLISAARVTPIRITHDGLSTLGDFDPLPVGEDLRLYWLNRVGGLGSKILSVLIQYYPNSLSVEELASAAGSTVNGHFNSTVSSLRTMGLMTPARTPIKASNYLFE